MKKLNCKDKDKNTVYKSIILRINEMKIYEVT